MTFWTNLVRHIRFADILDVALVSLFLYVFLTWMRERASRRTVLGVTFLAAIYFLASLFEMYMTETLIKVLLAVMVIAAVVVFQSDIRRLLDWLGTWRFSQRSAATSDASRTIDILTETVTKLADEKTGALIVIRGRELWDRHIHGGIELRGVVSEPLLRSVFNPKSPGHDGAVLIEGNAVTRFSVHLPLSKKVRTIGGTRHAAAQGLSEHCDAFIIVVSEERGTISVAEEGYLTQLESGVDLKMRLEKFWQEHYSTQSADRVRPWWRRQSVRMGTLSVSLALSLWALFVYPSETLYRSFAVPIEFRNLPQQLELKAPVPAEARITLSGSEQAFRLLEPSGLVISVDLSKMPEGEKSVSFSAKNLNLPAELKLHDIEPQSVRIQAQKPGQEP